MKSRFALSRTGVRIMALVVAVTFAPLVQAYAGQTRCLWDHLSPAGRDEVYAQYRSGGMSGFKDWRPSPLDIRDLVEKCVAQGGDVRMIPLVLSISMDRDTLSARLSQRGINAKEAALMWTIAKPAVRGEAVGWIDVSMADHSKQLAASNYFLKLAHSGYPALDPNSPDGADTLKLLGLYYGELAMAEWAEGRF